jgi:hypothetical protein
VWRAPIIVEELHDLADPEIHPAIGVDGQSDSLPIDSHFYPTARRRTEPGGVAITVIAFRAFVS